MKKSLPLILVVAAASPALAQVFHGSARVIPPDGSRDNMVYLFDAAGILTGSYDQIAGAKQDAWGYRDGMFDGTYVYFGWGGGLARHDADGSNGMLFIAGAAPGGVGTWRALAYDPTGDGGNGSIWTASFSSSLIEVDMVGNVLNLFPNGGYSLYGLSYNDDTGNLWGHSGGGEIISIDTSDGSMTTPMWFSGFPNMAAQGGLSGYSELGGNLAAVSQGTPDEFGIYDVAAGDGSLMFGPIDMQGQTGSNGHLGIAVVGGGGCPADCDGNGEVNTLDFLCFLNLYSSGDPAADCDGNGTINTLDFLCFLNAFNEGC